ncbi:MAG: 23S rRNA (uracil(1939)-C(5))-methyltransferase RlmD [candidate division Zixibacteria bacterium]|nr:23S rRNA (uracil(1939)-C(5))-methyltransferase RlmD [candidate division Zixibacteria bacterium]
MGRTAKTGHIIETAITDLAFDGRSVGEINGKIIFFNGGLPGEIVRAEIIRRKARYAFARVIEIINKSPDRIKAPCIHFDICGGCAWQDLEYSKQLYFKRKQISDCLRHIGRIDGIEIAETVASPRQYYYRNKMEFSLNGSTQDFVLGLHQRGHFDQIFDVKECLLQSSRSNQIADWFRAFVSQNGIPVYNISKHIGFIRFLAIREVCHTGQIMLNIVTTEGEIPHRRTMIEEGIARFPQISTILQNVNSSKSNIARGEKEQILYGAGFIEEKILDYAFRIYANSFFQTNSLQAEKLYQLILEMLQPQKNDCLLDLYCGTGTIGICAAKSVAKVVGIESEPSAILAARENALANGIGNIFFQTGLVEDILAEKTDAFPEFTAVIVDPPRAGMHPRALKKLVELGCPKMVYVSCNPATFARDASCLMQSGYKIGRIIPVDMFPHTMHIELVANLYK